MLRTPRTNRKEKLHKNLRRINDLFRKGMFLVKVLISHRYLYIPSDFDKAARKYVLFLAGMFVGQTDGQTNGQRHLRQRFCVSLGNLI